MSVCSPPSILTPLTLVLPAQGADMAPQLHQSRPLACASGSKLPLWALCQFQLPQPCWVLTSSGRGPGWLVPHLPVGPPSAALAWTLSPHILTEPLREDQERQYPHLTEST